MSTPTLVRGIPKVRIPASAVGLAAVLSSQLGYREGPNNDNVFGVWYGMNHAAWCAIFQSWGAGHAGCEKIIPRFAYTPAGAAWFQGQDRWHSSPKFGDLGFVYNPGPRIHHVFFVLSVQGAFVTTLEGNTNNTGSAVGNGVYSLRRAAALGAHGGYGRPAYTTAVAATSTTYRVKAGDTLSELAATYHTTVEAIARLNHIADPDTIAVGASIKIPAS